MDCLKTSVPQWALGFKLEKEKSAELTSFGGLPLLHDLFRKLGLPKLIRKHLGWLKGAGYGEDELMELLVSVCVAGGEHLEDIEFFRKDRAFQKLIEKEAIPGPKTCERFLKKFHQRQEKPGAAPAAWVPEETRALKGFSEVLRSLNRKVIERSGIKTATIENDCTVVFSHKEQALPTYKGGKGYQPAVGKMAELGLVLHDEFRDGNVNAAFDVKVFFQKCLLALPKTIQKVRLRGDGAYFNHDLMDFLDEKKIEFTISAERSDSMLDRVETIPEGEWQDFYVYTEGGKPKTAWQWAEFYWGPAQGSQADIHRRMRRHLVLRKPEEEQQVLFPEERSKTQQELRRERYEVVVTNMDWNGNRLLNWHHEKAGSIESTMNHLKNDLAGGVLPCAEFGANAAWWRIQCLAYNLLQILQRNFLPEDLSLCRLKKLRLHLFNIAGRVVEHARKIILRLSPDHPSFEIYRKARDEILAFAWA
jgi:hypothetical protein